LPWDPAPAPAPAPSAAALKAEAKEAKASPAISTSSNDTKVKQEAQYEPQVKAEPGVKYEGGSPYPNGYAPPSAVNPLARERAANLLQQQFGSQAAASIQAAGLHQQRSTPTPGQPRPAQSGIQFPGQAPRQQQGYQNGVGSAQTDGAGDAADEWSAIVADREAHDGEREVVDGMLRQHLEQSMSMVESGLMMPLRERVQRKKATRQSALATASEAGPSTVPSGVAQLDGDDEEDEDAINSDLDDSEDELDNNADGEDDGPLGETILCTYDKVQRVKNKVTPRAFCFPISIDLAAER
jgi:transcription initiation factor TFIIA large subunit